MMGKSESVEARFWAKVKKGGADECWEWIGGRNESGYGLVWFNRRTVRTHRLSYELHRGPVPGDLKVLHRCDNPPCVNPDHLFLGTDQDNANDKLSKNRHGVGEGRVSIRRKHEMLTRYQSGNLTQPELAKEFGVCIRTVRRIIAEAKEFA